MNTEDKAKLERLHQSAAKKTNRSFSSLEFDEFTVDAYNEGKKTNEILKEVHVKFNVKLTGQQLRGRLISLRRYGVNVVYRHNIKNSKRVPEKKTSKVERMPVARAFDIARIGAILRYNGDSKELINKYINEVVREAVQVDLKRLGV